MLNHLVLKQKQTLHQSGSTFATSSRDMAAIEDLWYRNAIIYCLDVEKYMDSNGDGIGDFEGLNARLEYLAGLGVNCVWLLPFYRSPNRDNGYDVSDYYSVHERHGSLGDFVEFVNHARAVGIRVIVDLVVNHTSRDHPWFQHARNDPKSPYRDWYVWSKERPSNHDSGMVFPGVQKTTWTLDRKAKQYYFHRFYNHQPDLNTHHPAVRTEIYKIMGFWLELGVSGFRMDAVPFLVEKKGAHVNDEQDLWLLQEMRDFLQWRDGDAVLLAEANVPPEESLKYFGDEGDRLQLMLNFPVNQRLWYALATGDIEPLKWAIKETQHLPPHAQYVQFLRSHDECDLGRLTEEQRKAVFAACGPKKTMQLYDRGIRRRFAPMLNGDRRRMELAFSMLFGLPGSPMLQYGDEIGMWDDLSLPERECARTAMQWSDADYGGFSCSRKRVVPIVDDEEHGFPRNNVADQSRTTNSFLNWTERRIRARKQLPEIGWGSCTILSVESPSVLVLRYDYRGVSVVTAHNFADRAQTVHFDVRTEHGGTMCDVFDRNHSRADAAGQHRVRLPAYGYRWFRVGASDTTPWRAVEI
jgi:maltose alpha-D-glucosyltransferase/alpha-amylase